MEGDLEGSVTRVTVPLDLRYEGADVRYCCAICNVLDRNCQTQFHAGTRAQSDKCLTYIKGKLQTIGINQYITWLGYGLWIQGLLLNRDAQNIVVYRLYFKHYKYFKEKNNKNITH